MFPTPLLKRGGGRRALSAGLLAVLASLLLLSGAQSGVTASDSGWYSGNPLLGPATLTNIVSAGGITYAAGASGTLLKSSDGGTSWTGIVTGIQQNLTIVRIVGGNPSSLVVGGASFLRRSDNSGQTFTRLPFASQSVRSGTSLVTVAFPSSSIGYLELSNGSVLSTADGGRTFTRKTAIPGGKPTDLIAVSDTTCFAVTEGGTVQRTTDGAGSWTQVASVPAALRGIEQSDASTMYAVGNNLTVLKSVDGGTTWNAKPVSGVPAGNLTSVRTSGPDVALFTTEGGTQLLRTTDGADTFASIVPSSDPTFGVVFASTARAITVGALGSAQTSDDGGANWRAVGSRIQGPFHVLYAVSGLVAYAGGENGVLARTVDGGQTWANISPPTSERILGIAAPTAETLFVLAADGSLQRSDNAGASYRILNTGTNSVPSAVVALDGQRILLIGPRGIRRSTNGGEEFLAVADKVAARAILRSVERVGNTVYAYGEHALLVSKDGGASWKAVKTPAKRSIHDLAFGTAATGFLLDTRGELWRTGTAGRSWQELECLGAWRLSGVDFADAKHGFVLGTPFGAQYPGAYLLRTNDGGKTWHPQFVTGGSAMAMEAAASTSYLLVGDSVLYATTSGGDVGLARKLTLTAKPKSLTKRATVAINGKLSQAAGGEDVIVSRYMAGSWVVRHATVASNGTFSTRWPVTRTAIFVAQSYGDADHAAAGTAALTVKLIPKARR